MSTGRNTNNRRDTPARSGRRPPRRTRRSAPPPPKRHTRRIIAASALLIVAAALAAWWWADNRRPTTGAESGAAAGRNVILLTLDTLRADHLACYGYPNIETPVIDRLAAGGARFEYVASAVPMTLPSHSSIMTGLIPPKHGVRDNGTFRLTPDHHTLAELFHENGYATAAFIGAFVLDARYGLNQGFDHYDDDLTLRYRLPTPNAPANPDRPANVVLDAALAWLDNHLQTNPDQPFFTWIHLFDAHMPYAPPEPYRTRYADHLYDGEIAFVDAQIGRLVDTLHAHNLEYKTLLVLVGDHGEGLGDHGEDTHRQLVYESTIRVPLIFWAPGAVDPGTHSDSFVAATIDLFPTIADLTDLTTPETVDGRKLFSDPLEPDRTVYMETLSTQLNDGWAPLFAVRRLHDKYIDAPNPEYYDLLNDPHELRNLLATHQDDVDQLADTLAAILDESPDADGASAVTPTDEEIQRLAALGYVVAAGGSAVQRSDLDPKIMILGFKERLRGAHLLSQGKPRQAAAVFQKLIKRAAGGSEVWSLLSTAQMMLGQTDQAIQSARRAVELNPAKPDRWCALARIYLSAENESEADVCLDQAQRLDPDDGTIYLIRARRAMNADRLDDALEFCRQAVMHDPSRATAQGRALAGVIHVRQGNTEQARTEFQAALQHDPRNGTALLGSARILAREGKNQQAIERVELLVEGQPEYLDGGRLLGRLHYEAGRADVAISILRVVVGKRPSDGIAHYQLARALAWKGRNDAAIHHLERAAALDALDPVAMQQDPSFAALLNIPRVAALLNNPQTP